MKVLLIRSSQVLALFLATCFVLAAREVNKSEPIAIEVTDERGSAIPNAKVEIIPVTDADGKTVVTDINGSAQLELQAGDYDAIVTAPAFKALSRCVSVSGDNRTIKFALRVGGCPGPDPCPVVAEQPEEKDLVTAAIVVTDSVGAVVRDAQIKLFPNAFLRPSRDSKTDAKGETLVSLPPGVYDLFVAVPPFLPAKETVQVGAAPNQTFRITLQIAELTERVRLGGPGPNFPLEVNLSDESRGAPGVTTGPPPSPSVASASLRIIVTDSIGMPIPYAQIGGLSDDGLRKFSEANEDGKLDLK
jgi:hypothetical protein